MKVEAPERIWIESEGECPYFYHEEELSDVTPPITEYVRADKLEELAAEIEALRAEVERLSRYYKNGIDCFANPCERHSGERTPPFAEFFEKYGGQCLICVVDNNKAMQAKIEAMELECDAMRTMIQVALEVLDEVCGNINPERGYADELETDVKRAIAALSLYNAKGE